VSDSDRIVMYCGKPVEDMDRDELIAALHHMSRLYRSLLNERVRRSREWPFLPAHCATGEELA